MAQETGMAGSGGSTHPSGMEGAQAAVQQLLGDKGFPHNPIAISHVTGADSTAKRATEQQKLAFRHNVWAEAEKGGVPSEMTHYVHGAIVAGASEATLARLLAVMKAQEMNGGSLRHPPESSSPEIVALQTPSTAEKSPHHGVTL